MPDYPLKLVSDGAPTGGTVTWSFGLGAVCGVSDPLPHDANPAEHQLAIRQSIERYNRLRDRQDDPVINDPSDELGRASMTKRHHPHRGGQALRESGEDSPPEAISQIPSLIPPTPTIQFGPVDPYDLVYAPYKAHVDDAGYDLTTTKEVIIPPGQFRDIPTNVWVALPPGWWGLVTGRSSALRRLHLLVHSGVIDTGYRGELFAGAFNLSGNPVTIHPGSRVAQFIPIPQPQMRQVWVDGPPPEGTRGAAGFGSTGC